jgi:hypothetical protein
MMLGVRRAGITVAVGALKTAGLIRNTHGRVMIIDPHSLEAALESAIISSGARMSAFT